MRHEESPRSTFKVSELSSVGDMQGRVLIEDKFRRKNTYYIRLNLWIPTSSSFAQEPKTKTISRLTIHPVTRQVRSGRVQHPCTSSFLPQVSYTQADCVLGSKIDTHRLPRTPTSRLSGAARSYSVGTPHM